MTLRLTNDGPGIAAADRQRIFERFVRAGESSGAGLGLPIARWIAEAHGGTLELEDSRPGGTTFVVTLPGEQAGGRNRQPFRRSQIDSSAAIAGRAYRRYRDGTMNRLRIVDVTSPPRITTASGCSIS